MAEASEGSGETFGPWTRLSTRLTYDNPWIKVREDQVIRPDGSAGIYGVVHFKNLAVAVVPVDAQGKVLLVGQYRYPLDRYSWEIPEGGCPEGEDPKEAAVRELREETGCTASCWDYLGTTALSNSATDEIGHLWLARELRRGEPSPEETEVLTLKTVDWEEAWRLAMEGEAVDALTAIGLARARHFLDREGKAGAVTPGAGRSPESAGP